MVETGVKVSVNAVKTGSVAGAAAAVTQKILSSISNTIKDLPAIGATMRLVKTIIGLLLLPLVPILVPVMRVLGEFAKKVAPIMQGLMERINKIFASGGSLGDAFAEIIKTYKDEVGPIVKELWNSVKEPLISAITSLLEALTPVLAELGITMFAKFLEFLIKDSSTISEKLLKLLWTLSVGLLNGIFIALKNWVLETAVKFAIFVLKSWEWMKDVGVKIWNIIKDSFQWLADKIKSVADSVGSFLKKGKNTGIPFFQLGGLVHNDGLAYLHKGERVINAANVGGTSNGGGMTFNINVGNPTIRSDTDIKELVKQISREMQIQMRRHTSHR